MAMKTAIREEAAERLTLVTGGPRLETAPKRQRDPEVFFDRTELDAILSVYGRKVAEGEWRDYAMGGFKDVAIFSVFRRASEMPLYRIEKRLRGLKRSTKLVPILGSVCDGRLMMEVCDGADLVVHAAAHKHVPLCESNPLAAIENNVRGTLTLVNAAASAEVKDFVLVSTDKAVRPASIMGSTKRVAEMIVAAKSSPHTRFATVRFGNVLDSDGSVLPLWREQIRNGGPLTLTDERCERYFMSIPDACELILGVTEMQEPGLFVFDMGEPRKLVDIAAELMVNMSMVCEIEIVGLRPGEKLTEELNFGGDLLPTSHPKINRVDECRGKALQLTMLDELLSYTVCRNAERAVSVLREMVAELRHAA